MLTPVCYVTPNLNKFIWELESLKGLNFEEYIFNVIKKELQLYYPSGLHIKKTTATRDDGIDIYISSPVSFNLMGVDFSLKGKENINVVIECKSTSQQKVSLDKFAKNIIVNKELPIDYFILVTNGTIVPYSYYKASLEFKERNCEFLLFDQYLLLNYLKKNNIEIPGDTSFFVFEEEPIHIEYQVRKGKINGRSCFDLYLVIKNYSSKIIEVTLNILSTRNWAVQNNVGVNIIPPFHSKCLNLIVSRIYNDGINDFRLNVFFNNKAHELFVKNPEVIYDFQPPLAGEQHKQIIAEMKESLLYLSSFQGYYLYGEAGIGKTRIIEEIIKEILDTDYKVFHFLCNIRNKKTLRTFLNAELKIQDDPTEKLWNRFYEKLRNDSFSRYFIIIEDIHNASEDFFLELKFLIQDFPQDIPCTLLIAAREDDTVYNESFYSFAMWLKENKKINDKEIVKFKDKECKQFIQSIIRDIPSLVLEKIVKLSNNNPFYIVQFIEYLLEINLVFLVNRNTVGITNVNTFSAQVYIPDKIQKLIELREKNLLLHDNGRQYLDFLYLISLYGINFPQEIIEEFWGYEYGDLLEPLFKRHFLSYDKSGNIKFDHETLFLYFSKQLSNSKNMKKICKLIVNKYGNLLYYLNNFQKGKVFFYAGQLEKAEKLFAPIIKEVEAIENISSVNLLPEYFHYLKEIYELIRLKANSPILEKLIHASVYIPMHNYDYGTTMQAINDALVLIKQNHINNEKLKYTILQLQAHTELTAANLAKAEQLFLELLVEERLKMESFTPQSRFDLFDRTASLYTRYNYYNLAQKYNKLASKVAYESEDSNLITLSVMMKAKINFYNNTEESVQHMLEAKKIMEGDKAYRINCHNNVSLLVADILLKYKKDLDLSEYIKDATLLLEEAIDKNYSFTIIRCNLLLAALYYLRGDNISIQIAEKYILNGINNSIHYGCEKLMNYFYNLKAIIALKKGMPDGEVMSYFNTMLYYLRKQNLLFLGNLDFCYGNIVSLTNYAKYIYNHGSEQMLYSFLSKLDYYQNEANCDFDCKKEKECYYTCKKNLDIFKKNISNIENKQLILVDEKNNYPLLDSKTNYFVIIH